MKKILERIYSVILLSIVSPMYALGLFFGWIITGKNVMKHGKLENIMYEIFDKYEDKEDESSIS